MLYFEMDLGRTRLDVCMMDEDGAVLEESPWSFDADGPAHLVPAIWLPTPEVRGARRVLK